MRNCILAHMASTFLRWYQDCHVINLYDLTISHPAMCYLSSSSFDRIPSVSSVVVPCIALDHAYVDKPIFDPSYIFHVDWLYGPHCLMCHHLHSFMTGTGFLLVICSFSAFRISRDHRLLSGISGSPTVLLTDSECCNLPSISHPLSPQPPRVQTLARTLPPANAHAIAYIYLVPKSHTSMAHSATHLTSLQTFHTQR